jgi:hypothetical protein
MFLKSQRTTTGFRAVGGHAQSRSSRNHSKEHTNCLKHRTAVRRGEGAWTAALVGENACGRTGVTKLSNESGVANGVETGLR